MSIRYRKVHTHIWNQEGFASLSNEAKLSYFYIITHPNMTSLGAMRGSIRGVSSELSVKVQSVEELLDKHLICPCPTTSTIYVRDFVKWQSPESPNVVKAWGKSMHLIPEGNLKREAIADAKAYVEGLTKAFQVAFTKAFEEGRMEAFAEDGMEVFA